ncbi:MAG: hypothetical protein WA584_02195 [Pyrinomonadaceae bacterium]
MLESLMNIRAVHVGWFDKITNLFEGIENFHSLVYQTRENECQTFSSREISKRNNRALPAGDKDDETIR